MRFDEKKRFELRKGVHGPLARANKEGILPSEWKRINLKN
jgi:hypothetical protein